MNHQVRRVAAFVLVLFGALFINLNVQQVLRAEAYRENPRNVIRQLEREYSVQRGSILLADGATEAARSEDTAGELRFRRVFTDGPLYAHVTGYSSFIYGRTGLERAQNEVLSGQADVVGSIGDLLSGREQHGDTVVSTIQPAVQAAARQSLGDRRGAVVALDPSTGAVLALWSSPSYDPNQLSAIGEGAGETIRATWEQFNADPGRPLENRALRGLYAPGSTFKLVTAAAALESGLTPESPFDDPPELDLPQTTATIGNFGGGRCNGGQPLTLAQALAVSCNTTFARLGLDLGAARLVQQAQAFGLGGDLGGQLDGLEPSVIPPPDQLDPPATAQSAIGQRDVRVTPLQMAALTGAIGEGGVLRAPRLVDRIEDFGGETLRSTGVAEVGRPVSQGTAAALTEMMVGVVERGSGTAAAIEGVRVAGKTGTAESGVEGAPPTVWFTCFAPAEDPVVAVAVVVEDGGEVGNEATGGRVAAPIARGVVQAALALPRS